MHIENLGVPQTGCVFCWKLEPKVLIDVASIMRNLFGLVACARTLGLRPSGPCYNRLLPPARTFYFTRYIQSILSITIIYRIEKFPHIWNRQETQNVIIIVDGDVSKWKDKAELGRDKFVVSACITCREHSPNAHWLHILTRCIVQVK